MYELLKEILLTKIILFFSDSHQDENVGDRVVGLDLPDEVLDDDVENESSQAVMHVPDFQVNSNFIRFSTSVLS